MGSPAELHSGAISAYGGELRHSYSSQLEQKVQTQAAELHNQADELDWSAHYRTLLEAKLEEAGLSPPRLSLGSGTKASRKPLKVKDSQIRHQPSHVVSAIAQSKNETRALKDQLAKMERRALIAEERAAEAVVVERKARAAMEGREKQMSSMRLRLDKMAENNEASEAHRKELQEYVGKLERKLGGRRIGLFRRGAVSSFNSYEPNKVEKESLFDALTEIRNENANLHSALQEVEEALECEARALSLADGGAVLESLRTRRMLESAELALKKETNARQHAEAMAKHTELRAQRAEDKQADRVRAEDALLARCELTERDNQALLEYVQELTADGPVKRPFAAASQDVNELKAMNEQLVKTTREAREKAAQLQWQLEHESRKTDVTSRQNDERLTAALGNIVDDLQTILSKCLGVAAQELQHPSDVDSVVFAVQRLVTKLQTELQATSANRSELRASQEALRSLQAELRVYKMKCERLVTRADELEDELVERPSPSISRSPANPAAAVVKSPAHPASQKDASQQVFASRIERIATLKRRLGLTPHSTAPKSGGYRRDSDSSDED